MKGLVTIAALLAAWLPGGAMAAAEAATTERQHFGIRVEQLFESSAETYCTLHYINPSHIAHVRPGNKPRTDWKPFHSNCDRPATVEGTVIRLHSRHGSNYDDHDYLYNGSMDEFRRELWDAHP